MQGAWNLDGKGATPIPIRFKAFAQAKLREVGKTMVQVCFFSLFVATAVAYKDGILTPTLVTALVYRMIFGSVAGLVAGFLMPNWK